MKFFNLDLHISVIADIKSIFTELGHSVDNWSISGHAHVMGESTKNVEFINQHTWRNIDDNLINKFYDRYKDTLSSYDGFIVTHTPCFSLLYEKFNKPIITVATTRYEEPFSNDMIKWSKLNHYLQGGIDSGKIIPVTNNKYDKRYTELFTNRTWEHIPSLCEYTNAQYTGIQGKFLYSSKFKPSLKIKGLVDKQKEFPNGYDWQELADYKGIVHIPYNISTMSIFEQYTSNIPLFFPSLKFLSFLRGNLPNGGILSETSWNQVHGLPSNSVLFCGLEDPNNYKSLMDMMKWVELADFYDTDNMPHIQYFNSWEHLNEIIHSVDLQNISAQMKGHNKHRKEKVYASWKKILESIAC
jgi:hypothetical protein